MIEGQETSRCDELDAIVLYVAAARTASSQRIAWRYLGDTPQAMIARVVGCCLPWRDTVAVFSTSIDVEPHCRKITTTRNITISSSIKIECGRDTVVAKLNVQPIFISCTAF